MQELEKEIRKLGALHDSQRSNLVEMNEIHEKIRELRGIIFFHVEWKTKITCSIDEKESQDFKGKEQMASYDKLCEIYKQFFVESTDEIKAISVCIPKLKKVLQLQHKKESSKRKFDSVENLLPMKQPKNGSEMIFFIGLISYMNIWDHDTYVLRDGLEVAALTDVNSKPKMWILASIKKYIAQRERYQVVDEDPGDDDNPHPVRKNYIVDASKVVPIYPLDLYPLSKRRVMKADERVLALFPGTTVFYPCNVMAVPKPQKSPEYVLAFDDDDEQTRKVSAKYVFPFPSGYIE